MNPAELYQVMREFYPSVTPIEIQEIWTPGMLHVALKYEKQWRQKMDEAQKQARK